MIRVTIEAPQGAGKSRIGAYLARGLMKHGIAVVAHEPAISRRMTANGGRLFAELDRMGKAGACIEIVEVQTNPKEGSHEESPES